MKKRWQIREMKKRDPKLNPRRAVSCLGKIRYDTYEQADQAARAAVNCHAYKCDYCPYYHKGRKQK